MNKPVQVAHFIIRKPMVCKRTGFSPALLYAKLDPKSISYDATFPRQVRLGAAAVGWFEHEIQAWLESRPRVVGTEQEEKA